MQNQQDSVQTLEYNSERSKLIIPEYGRHLQKLIFQAVEIEDRAERNKAARYIIDVMGTLNPHLRDVPDFQHKLWDQIFIMSDFKLDVDSPFPIITPELLYSRPERLNYPQNFPRYRFYGNNVKAMIDVACKWEDGDLKNLLIKTIANTMKKAYLTWNKDTVKDEVILEHLYELSKGKIDIRESNEELVSSNKVMQTQQQRIPVKNNNNNNKPKPKQKPFFKKNNN